MENIFQVAILLKTIDQATRPLHQITDSVKKLEENVTKATGKFQQFQEKLQKLEQTATSLQGVVGAAAWTGAFAGMMKSFAELEDAQTMLQSTFMEAGGVIPSIFAEIDSEAKKLGAELPGTTADFYRLAATMKQLGVSSESIARGGLRAAAYLGAVLKVPYEQAGEAVAKFKQALGIADKDLLKFIDTIQRTAHLGVRFTEMQYAFAKLSGTLKILNWQGLEYANQLAPIVARFIQLGYTGETVGTNLSRVFEAMLDAKKLGKFNQELAKYGIHLELIDKQTGKLKSPVEVIAELNKITEAYKAGIIKTQDLYRILSQLTGASGEDLKMLATLVTEGAEGFNKMSREMARQADLQKRVDAVTKTLANTWEAFTGTLKNLFALVGAQVAPVFKSLADFLNDLTDRITRFAEKHKTLAAVMGWGITIFAGLAGGAVALALAISALLFPFRILITTVSIVGPFLRLGSILHLAGYAFRFLGNAILFVGRTLLVLGRFLLANPVLLAIGLIATAVYLIYKNWKPLSEFFRNLWRGIISALSSAWSWIVANWKNVLGIFLWVSPISAPIMALQKLVKFVFGIDLFQAGQKIIKSLWEGMKSLASKPVEIIKDIAQKIRNYLPFSPAKEGPLADLHRVKIIETIAETLSPAPLLAAMKQVLEPVKALTQPLIQPVRQVLEPVKALAQPIAQRLLPVGAVSMPAVNVSISGITIYGTISEKEKEKLSLDIKDAVEKAIQRISFDRFRRQY